jgi:hypothetical protein
MSINSRHAVDQKKVRRYGKYYGSIDFECNHEVTADVFSQMPDRPVIGTFTIAGKNFDLTWDEMELIEDTMRIARETTLKRYRLGMMGTLSR